MDNKTEILNEYQKGYELIIDMLNELPNEVFDYKPSEDKWTVRDIIVHIVDSELNGSIRLRNAIAENGHTVTPYDQDKWAKQLFYEFQSIDDNLELFKHLRILNHKLLLNIDHKTWENNYFSHPERGNITVHEHIKELTEHIETHISQILRNYEHWQEHSKPAKKS